MTAREKLIELIEKAKEEYANDITDHTETDYIVETLLNEGVIVPPCKVGDTVYYLNTISHMALYKNKIYEAKVVRIVTTSLGTVLVIQIRDEFGCCEIPDIRDWGKTVFLTKEGAENALAEMRKINGN